ncbi:MAG: NAD-dependent epimerase/dehydratase family protein [Planctomycetota bacterium]
MPAPVLSLITGGAGFIGSHLAERLLSQGRSVRLVDDFSTGRRENISGLLGPRCELIEGRAAEVLSQPGVLDGVDEVFHLAASVGVRLIVEDPAGMIQNNVDQTVGVLRACADHGLRVLIASSSEVYGKNPNLPLREDQDLLFGPTSASRWSYGLTKAIDEHLALDMARRHGLQAVVVRLFNTIGPRQVGRYGMVVPRFVERAVAGQPLEVYGDGSQTRAFCDVRDVTAALPELLRCDDALGLAVNVGADHTVTIRELAERVIGVVSAAGGPESEVRLVPYQAVYGEGFEDTPCRMPDTARLRGLIGFERRFDLDQTLSELVATAMAGPGAVGTSTASGGGGP